MNGPNCDIKLLSLLEEEELTQEEAVKQLQNLGVNDHLIECSLARYNRNKDRGLRGKPNANEPPVQPNEGIEN